KGFNARRVAMVGSLAWFLLAGVLQFQQARSHQLRAQPGDWPALLFQDSSPNSWVLADNVIDAYRARRLVPPELAVWSDKRRTGGFLSRETLIAIIKKRRPEQIVLPRFEQPRALLEYLNSSYVMVPSAPNVLYYVRPKPQVRSVSIKATAAINKLVATTRDL